MNKWLTECSTASYPAFTPQAYKTIKPDFNGTTSYIAESNANNVKVSVYGTTAVNGVMTLDHTFYLFARQSGYYSFNIPYTDDVEFVWIGANALTGWTRANANLFQYWQSGLQAQTPQTLAYYLNLGDYLPVRVMWGNGGGAGELRFTIYAPDGNALLQTTAGANTGSSTPDVVQFPCITSLGAKFPAWGSET